MKLSRIFVLIAAVLFMASCDDTTDNIGHSVTNRIDGLSISDSTFNVTTESMTNYRILSNSRQGIVGMMKDPETDTYVTADYMAQFSTMPNFALDTLQYIKDANDGKVTADSCYILINYQTTYGDTLAPMNVTAYEMSTPMQEGEKYYTDFDPIASGYVDTENAYKTNTTYSLKNQYFKIYLNEPYTAKDGTEYKNYGEYIMHMRMDHPEYFKNNYQFVHNVCPGFYIKHESGVGNMAKIFTTQLVFCWKRQKTVESSTGLQDSIVLNNYSYSFFGTEEVLQTNRIQNSKERLDEMVADNSCTYIKSPAGIMTVATLPVEDILKGHEKDTLSMVSVTFPRINNQTDDDYAFETPYNVLMIPLDSLTSFFENKKVTDYRISYSSTYNSSSSSYAKNAYTFPNISNLVTTMGKIPTANRSSNWNKVAILPVDIDYITRDNYQYVNTITHEMGLSSVRLVKGEDTYDAQHKPTGSIQAKVIYSKFREKE